MASKYVSIKYQYFEVCSFVEDNEYRYDFRNWISKMADKTLEERIADVNGIKGRLEDIQLIFNDEYYALNFMRMDEISNTYFVYEDADAVHIDLEEGEYIGRNTVVLYDPALNVLMVQCNRGSYGVSAIESYINNFNHEDEMCYLRPILNNFNGDIRDDQKFMKIDVRFSNVRDLQVNSRYFERIIETCNDLECLTAHIEFGLGYNRGEELEKDTITAMIDDIRNERNRDCISSAKIVLTDDQKSNIIDLFRNIDNDIIKFSIPPRGELGFLFMADKMVERYDESSKIRIMELLRREE